GDWSSDVCSSDLDARGRIGVQCDVVHLMKGERFMKRTVLYPVVPVCALILTLPFSQISLAAGANKLASHTVVAASGSAAPAGGTYATVALVSLNARSQIVFDALLGGRRTTGVLDGYGRTTSTITRAGG